MSGITGICKRQKMQDFAQKYESTIEVSLAAMPPPSTGRWKQTPEVLASHCTAGGTFHPAFAPLSFFLSFFLRPSVIGALFGEIN